MMTNIVVSRYAPMNNPPLGSMATTLSIIPVKVRRKRLVCQVDNGQPSGHPGGIERIDDKRAARSGNDRMGDLPGLYPTVKGLVDAGEQRVEVKRIEHTDHGLEGGEACIEDRDGDKP